jgi:hypothetical protein
MKQLILLFIISFVSSAAFSQTLNVVSTFPEDGAADVETDSIVITFDKKIYFEVDEFGDPNVYLYIEPEDSVEYVDVAINEDSTSVTFYGELADNTDYVAVLEYAEGADGELLDMPYIFQFTTNPTAGQFTVSGTVGPLPPEKVVEGVPILVFLSPENFELGFEDEFTDCGDCDEDDDGPTPFYAAFADPETGEYTIDQVREGTYFPLGVDYDVDLVIEDEFYNPGLYYYDANGNFTPDQIDVNSTTAPNNELTNINLIQLDLSPYTFEASIARATDLTSTFGEDVVFVGGGTEIDLFDYDFEETSSEKATPQKKGSFFSQLATIDKDQLMATPDGKSIVWQQYFYDPGLDAAFSIVITPIGSFVQDTIASEEDAEIPVDFTTIKPVPDQIVDSDDVITTAEANGGADFRAQFSDDPNAFGYVSLELLHAYWELDGGTTESPVFWNVRYYYASFNDQTFEYTEDSAYVYIHAETGAILESTLPVSNEVEEQLPDGFELNQNYPNPFNPSTNIPFTLSEASRVSIDIYNILGQKVETLTDQMYNAGTHSMRWDASGFSSGIYIYRMRTNGNVQTRKMMLLK